MPATLKSTVGSCGIRLAEGTRVWSLAAKKSRKESRSWSAFIDGVISRASLSTPLACSRVSTATPSPRSPVPTPPDDLHEWVSFEDPDEQRTWVFDASYLRSNYMCIYGCGCKGILDEPAPELQQGCCSHGAHFVDDDDIANLVRHAERLTPEHWQFHKKGHRTQEGQTKKGYLADGEPEADGSPVTTTRVVDDACIFLNRVGFEGGVGCALHIAAVEAG